jgi:hypothetical protein
MVVCYGFGLNASADFPVSAGMVCGLVAQAVDLPGGEIADNLSVFADGACSGGELASDAGEPAKYVGIACSWASDLLGALDKPAGVIASLGCTLAPSLGYSLGARLESKYEFDIAMDVMQRGRCIKYSPTRLVSPWVVDKCKPGDPGFSDLPLAPTGGGTSGTGSGTGGAGGGSGGGGGSGPGSSPEGEPPSSCKIPLSTQALGISLASNYSVVDYPLNNEGKAFTCGSVADGLAGNRLFLALPREEYNGTEAYESHTWAYEDLTTHKIYELPAGLSTVSDNGEYASSVRKIYKIDNPADNWTPPFPSEVTAGTEYSEIAAISDNGEVVVYWVQGSKGPSESGTYLYVAHRSNPTPELLSEGPKPWSFAASISGNGKYVVWHDDGGTDEVPRILNTETRERTNLTSENLFENPWISEDGERVLLVDFFGKARLEQRVSGKITDIPQPINGLNTELTYILTYAGNYDCPTAMERYDVATGEEEPVIEATGESECALSRGAGFGAPNLLVANNGEDFYWNTPRSLLRGDNNAMVDAYHVHRTGP